MADFWQEPLPALLARQSASPAGLAAAEAARRLDEVGPNVLQQRRESTLFRLLASRFRNPLVILLVAASAIAALTGDVRSCAVITAMIVFSVLLDSVQEHRAGQAAERLR